MPVTKVQIHGLKDFRRELRALKLTKELSAVHKRVAELVAQRARAAAPGETGQAITARANQRAASLGIGRRPPWATVTFFGAKRRTGWYARRRYRDSPARQHQPWVGNQWDPGETGGTPYFIGPAINDAVPEVVELMGDEMERLAGEAFPEGGR